MISYFLMLIDILQVFLLGVYRIIIDLFLGVDGYLTGIFLDVVVFLSAELMNILLIQSTFIISNSKGLSEILRDIRISTYQICRSEENNKSNNLI